MRKEASLLFFKNGNQEDLGNCRLVNIMSVPGEMMEKIIIETKHISDGKRSSQYRFTKGKLCLTNLITSCDENTNMMG